MLKWRRCFHSIPGKSLFETPVFGKPIGNGLRFFGRILRMTLKSKLAGCVGAVARNQLGRAGGGPSSLHPLAATADRERGGESLRRC